MKYPDRLVGAGIAFLLVGLALWSQGWDIAAGAVWGAGGLALGWATFWDWF